MIYYTFCFSSQGKSFALSFEQFSKTFRLLVCGLNRMHVLTYLICMILHSVISRWFEYHTFIYNVRFTGEGFNQYK